MKAITPCLWFNGEGQDAANFYCNLFEGSVKSDSGTLVEFELNRRPFSALNGGPMYKINESVSFFVYCGSDERINKLYLELMNGGQALMPLDKYPWSRKYAWVKDKFGVSWQLDIDPINNPQKIVPAIMFVNDNRSKIRLAIDFYTSVFPDSTELFTGFYNDSLGMPPETIQFAQIKLNGNIFNLMSSHVEHDWNLNEAISFVIRCDNQDELNHYWNSLLQKGGKEMQCGWLKDQFGVTWQIIPTNLGELLKKQGGMEKMLKMKKIEIAGF